MTSLAMPFDDRRASVSLLVAVALPAMVLLAGISLDVAAWALQQTKLQHMVDAAAVAGARQAASGGTAQQNAGVAADLAELNGAAGVASRTWNAATATLSDGEVSVAVGASKVHSGGTAIAVTATRTVTGPVSALLPNGAGTRTLVTSGTAETWSTTNTVTSTAPCVLALDGSANSAIKADNMGVITATGCGIFSNSSNATSIYLNSGTISGQSVGAVGGIVRSNSGSNTFSPMPGTSYAAAVGNPYGGRTVPSYGACSYTNASFSAYSPTPYAFTQARNVFCGNTTIGGNASTDTFAPGIYYVVNGNLIFNNATITQASGVSFVLTGSSPGSVQWTNYSNTNTTITPPTTGATAGIVFWQACPASGNAPDNSMAGGSTLILGGTFYAPCGALNMSNNARLNAPSSGGMDVVVRTLYAAGSAQVNAKPVSVTTTVTGSALVQ